MDNLSESIEVIRLKSSKGRYLNADEDEKSISFYYHHDKDKPIPQSTEWRVTWLGAQKFLLKSIYGKVFTIRRRLTATAGAPSTAHTVNTMQVLISIYSKQENWPVRDGAGDLYVEMKNALIDGTNSVKEVKAKLMPYHYSSYTLEDIDGLCLKGRMLNYVQTKLYSMQGWNLSSAGWTVEVVHQTHNRNNNNIVNSNSMIHKNIANNNSINSVEQKAIPFDKKLAPLQGVVPANMYQVGQMIFNVSDLIRGGNAGVGGLLSSANSGHNVNGSGTQTNGDVNVKTNIGTQENASVVFYTGTELASSRPL